MKVTGRWVGVILIAGLSLGGLGCAGEAASTPALPGSEASAIIPASGETTTATSVVSWKVYEDENGLDVYGLDQAGQVVAVTAMHVSTAQDPTILLEEKFPSKGVVELARNGTVLQKTIDDVSMHELINRMGTDFRSVTASNPYFLSCLRASAELVAGCGLAMAACLESAGLVCGVSDAACIDVFFNWLCKCKHKHWACG